MSLKSTFASKAIHFQEIRKHLWENRPETDALDSLLLEYEGDLAEREEEEEEEEGEDEINDTFAEVPQNAVECRCNAR